MSNIVSRPHKQPNQVGLSTPVVSRGHMARAWPSRRSDRVVGSVYERCARAWWYPGPGRRGPGWSDIQNAATDGHFLEFRCGFDACTLPIGTTNGFAAKRIRSKDHTGGQYDHFYYRLFHLTVTYNLPAALSFLVFLADNF